MFIAFAGFDSQSAELGVKTIREFTHEEFLATKDA